jgi:hypothetical protein
MDDLMDVSYGMARMGTLKAFVVAWIGAGGTTDPNAKAPQKVHRIWKHAEVAVIQFFDKHKEEARIAGSVKTRSTRGQRPKHSTWGVRL